MKPIEKYLAFLDDLAGAEPGDAVINKISLTGLRPIVVISYDGVPEEGHRTTFTYGLSSAARPEWQHSRPELLISVKSVDDAWGLAMGDLVCRAAGEALFSYGDVYDFDERISEESPMQHLAVFACSLLPSEEACVDLGDRRVRLSQLYPVHASEIALLARIGPEKFFSWPGVDFLDVRRPEIAAGPARDQV